MGIEVSLTRARPARRGPRLAPAGPLAGPGGDARAARVGAPRGTLPRARRPVPSPSHLVPLDHGSARACACDRAPAFRAREGMISVGVR